MVYKVKTRPFYPLAFPYFLLRAAPTCQGVVCPANCHLP